MLDQKEVATKVKYIFDAISRAGISMVDAAKLTNVSRESLYRWKKGKNVSDKFRLDFVYAYALRLDKAVTLERLPLKDKLQKAQRIAVLRKIVQEMSSK